MWVWKYTLSKLTYKLQLHILVRAITTIVNHSLISEWTPSSSTTESTYMFTEVDLKLSYMFVLADFCFDLYMGIYCVLRVQNTYRRYVKVSPDFALFKYGSFRCVPDDLDAIWRKEIALFRDFSESKVAKMSNFRNFDGFSRVLLGAFRDAFWDVYVLSVHVLGMKKYLLTFLYLNIEVSGVSQMI